MNKIAFWMTALLPLAAQSQISVENAKVFATQTAGEPTAVFMTLHNHNHQPVNLAMVQSDLPVRLALHGMQQGKMIDLSGIEIPAQGDVRLTRGGLHIMIFDAPALHEGEKFPLLLMFDNGEKIQLDVDVVKP